MQEISHVEDQGSPKGSSPSARSSDVTSSKLPVTSTTSGIKNERIHPAFNLLHLNSESTFKVQTSQRFSHYSHSLLYSSISITLKVMILPTVYQCCIFSFYSHLSVILTCTVPVFNSPILQVEEMEGEQLQLLRCFRKSNLFHPSSRSVRS